jgi:hypothetical protein
MIYYQAKINLLKVDGLVKTQTCPTDGYVQKLDIQSAVVSTKRRGKCGTPSIGRSRDNAGDRTFYHAIKRHYRLFFTPLLYLLLCAALLLLPASYAFSLDLTILYSSNVFGELDPCG